MRRLFALLFLLASVPVGADHPVLLGSLKGANFNSTADQAIDLREGNYVLRRITVTNCSANLTLAVGGFYSGAGKTGSTIVAATQTYVLLTAASKYLDVTLTALMTTDKMTAIQIFLSLTTGQGGAATCDVYVFGDALP